jgi:hypothetical protein
MTDALRSIDHGVTIDRSLGELPTFFETNAAALAAILRIYACPGMRVADVTWGHGAFWTDIPDGTYDRVATDLARDGVDLRLLPYACDSFDVLVLDPPYRYAPRTTKLLGNYNVSYNFKVAMPDLDRISDVIRLYEQGIVEARRVLRHGGFCVVKCQDTVAHGQQYWVHVELMEIAEREGFAIKDLAVVATGATPPPSRWRQQKHLRKTHSYFLVLRKGGFYPFGAASTQSRKNEE